VRISTTWVLRQITKRRKDLQAGLGAIPDDMLEKALKGAQENPTEPITFREIVFVLMINRELTLLYLLLDATLRLSMRAPKESAKQARELVDELRFEFENRVKGVYGDYAKLLMEVRRRRPGPDIDPAIR